MVWSYANIYEGGGGRGAREGGKRRFAGGKWEWEAAVKMCGEECREL